MEQRGFIKITVGIVILFIVVAGYLAISNSPAETSLENTGAYIPGPSEIIRVIFPSGGEKLEIGKTYEVRWENNIIKKAPISIQLEVITSDGKTYIKTIADNIPSSPSGTHKWTVTSEPIDSKYKIVVSALGAEANRGRSEKHFFIIGTRS